MRHLRTFDRVLFLTLFPLWVFCFFVQIYLWSSGHLLLWNFVTDSDIYSLGEVAPRNVYPTVLAVLGEPSELLAPSDLTSARGDLEQRSRLVERAGVWATRLEERAQQWGILAPSSGIEIGDAKGQSRWFGFWRHSRSFRLSGLQPDR